MRPGLEFNEDYDNPVSEVSHMLFGNHRNMVSFAARKALETKPDTAWQYSTSTSTILGVII